MKIIKAKVYKRRESDKCKFNYPKGWDASKIHVLAYEDYPDNLGDVIEYCLAVADDEVAEKLIADGEAEELDTDQANEFGRQWRPQRVRINNEERIAQIIRKIRQNTECIQAIKKILASTELKALDEDDPEPGIVKTKLFNILDHLKT